MTTLERAYAIAYAERGWPVFPLHRIVAGRCACGDPDCTSAGKHPIPTGWPNTLASVPAAKSLWRDHLAERGIGLACGPRAGMWALDVDPRHGGDRSIAELQARHGRLPRSLRSLTGGDGVHIVFAWPEGGLTVRNSTQLPDGLDVRGEGGYIVLPPSLHVSGQRYAWGIPPSAGMLEPAPEWLLELVRRPPRTRSRARERVDGEALPAGKRHQGLLDLAVVLVGRGTVEQDLLTGALAEANRARCEPPLADAEVEKLAGWALKSQLAEHERAIAGFTERIHRARAE